MDPCETPVLRPRRLSFFQWFDDKLNRLGILWPRYYQIETYPQSVDVPIAESSLTPLVIECDFLEGRAGPYPSVLERKSRNRWLRIELKRYNRTKFRWRTSS